MHLKIHFTCIYGNGIGHVDCNGNGDYKDDCYGKCDCNGNGTVTPV